MEDNIIELLNNELAFVNGGICLLEEPSRYEPWVLREDFNALAQNDNVDYQSASRFACELQRTNPKLFHLLGSAFALESAPADGNYTKQYLKARGAAHNFFNEQLVD